MLKAEADVVADCDRNPVNAALVGALVEIARATGRRVLAAGVDTAAQLAAVAKLGCDEASGLALSSPLTGDDFAALLSGGGTVAHWRT